GHHRRRGRNRLVDGQPATHGVQPGCLGGVLRLLGSPRTRVVVHLARLHHSNRRRYQRRSTVRLGLLVLRRCLRSHRRRRTHDPPPTTPGTTHVPDRGRIHPGQ